jgi:large subunit ribosomal protein L17
MRHRKKGKILSRATAPRKALIRSLATSLVVFEKVKTTEAKAKLLRPYVEKMITMGKRGDLHARRELMKKLYTESAVKKVLEVLSPRYKERKGGYLRIVKVGIRRGDAAKVAKIEFVK